jgi:hypothetical protein
MYTIRPLTSARVAEALQFVCKEFVTESVVHRALSIEYGPYLEYMDEPFTAMAADGLSFVAVEDNSDTLVGCLLAGDFNKTYPNTTAVPDALAPVKGLLSALEKAYRTDQQGVERTARLGDILLVDIATVATRARQQGLYRQLRLAAQSAAKTKGFNRVIGELSSMPTQRFCIEKLGHRVVSEVHYASFRFNGVYPFAAIEQPPSIQLVEGAID